ncbi:uncharacterized protein EI90DRAFT_414914 [Cantharellus anzutake]|uniref:uncharacterized protein n=1 Tax=Cantharellus anzutake TaxID=1750568 RepID=UPI001907DEFF|nr:uncharacterized protein EI90DRAFT_414914 [Cantharellus anzutake]KAF8314824.1 hypothetical protein EI90DRAFT_414914 [Cantharellus anzutake]
MAPKKSSQRRPGSRAGYLLYENLYRNLDIYPWAKNHTVQSWNNHYKKHMEFYDRQIDRYKEKHGISSGDDEFEDLDFHSEGSVSPQRHELPKRRLPRRESPPDIPEGSGNGSRRSRATSEDDSDGEYRPRPKPRKIARTPAIHHISHIAGISGSSAEERSDSAQSLRRPTVRELRPGRNLSAHSADSPRGEVPRSESHSRDADESNSSESGFGRIREGDPENQAEWAKRPRKLQESPDGDGNSAAANESTQEVEEDLRGGEEESSAEVEPPPKNSTNILSSHVTRTRHARRAGLISPPRRVTRSGARVQAGRRVTRQRGR